MIKVHCRDGKTLSFDLTLEAERVEWMKLNSDRDFLKSVTGIGVLYNKHWHTLPFPKKFNHIQYNAELVQINKGGVVVDVGERIICQADDIQINLMVYFGHRPKMARVDVKKIGKQRFSPKGGVK